MNARATIVVRAADVTPGSRIIDGDTYSVGSDCLTVLRVEHVDPDDYSTDPDGTAVLHFGPGHHLALAANDAVQVIA